MAAMSGKEFRSKVNGKFLAQFNGKPVTVLGKVKQVHPNGSSFEIETTDGMTVNAILREPLSEPIEGWVEVRGEGQGKCHISAQHYIVLRESIMQDFDKDLYDDLISTINSCENPFAL